MSAEVDESRLRTPIVHIITTGGTPDRSRHRHRSQGKAVETLSVRLTFVVFTCAGIADELIGSELFGYVEGSFTGAGRGGSIGKIQLAHKGTLFLDDIDCMPTRMQVSLLRVGSRIFCK
jgi:transcriptional regulator of acetoin/glycerol metabolism